MAVIQNELVIRLYEKLKKEKMSVPKFEKLSGINSDRIYKWKQEGTSPKVEDAKIISNFLDGKMDIPPRETHGEKAKTEKYVQVLEDRVKELKEDKEWLKRKLDVSLDGISTGVVSMFARIEVILDQDAHRDAAGDKQKSLKKRQETDKRISDKVQELQNKGTLVLKNK